jgi:hypothetical protein
MISAGCPYFSNTAAQQVVRYTETQIDAVAVMDVDWLRAVGLQGSSVQRSNLGWASNGDNRAAAQAVDLS